MSQAQTHTGFYLHTHFTQAATFFFYKKIPFLGLHGVAVARHFHQRAAPTSLQCLSGTCMDVFYLSMPDKRVCMRVCVWYLQYVQTGDSSSRGRTRRRLQREAIREEGQAWEPSGHHWHVRNVRATHHTRAQHGSAFACCSKPGGHLTASHHWMISVI